MNYKKSTLLLLSLNISLSVFCGTISSLAANSVEGTEYDDVFINTPPCTIGITGISNVNCTNSTSGLVCFEITESSGPNSVTVSQPGQADINLIVNDNEEACVSGLVAGPFTITSVSGTIFCEEMGNIESSSTLEFDTSQFNIQAVSCNGGNDGSITMDVDGGNPPYSYNWSNGFMEESPDSLVAGTYVVSVTDEDMCLIIMEFSVVEPMAIMIDSSSISNVSCFGEGDGSIFVQITGGVSPYEMLWSNGSSSMNQSTLDVGTYSFQLSDSNNCIFESNDFVIEEPNEINAEIITVDVTCKGDNDGSMEVNNPVGGHGEPFSYLWSTGLNSQGIDSLSGGDYEVTVSDNIGCSRIFEGLIEEPDAILVDEIATNLACFGDSNGTIHLETEGGTPAYVYEWSNNDTTSTIENLEGGNYSYTITDANECTYSAEIIIDEPDQLIPKVIVDAHVSCDADSNGILRLTISGGVGDIDVFWNTANTDLVLTDLAAGMYTVTITDENDCIASDTAFVAKELNPIITIPFPENETYSPGESILLTYSTNDINDSIHWAIVETINVMAKGETQGLAATPLTISGSFTLEKSRAPGWVIIELYAERETCIGDTIQTRINLFPEEGALFIPEVFTPNNDDTNDFWDIVFPFPGAANDYSIKIFNRSGGMVYERHDLTQQWDAEGCPDGVYYYVISNTTTDEIYKGAVTILRK